MPLAADRAADLVADLDALVNLSWFNKLSWTPASRIAIKCSLDTDSEPRLVLVFEKCLNSTNTLRNSFANTSPLDADKRMGDWSSVCKFSVAHASRQVPTGNMLSRFPTAATNTLEEGTWRIICCLLGCWDVSDERVMLEFTSSIAVKEKAAVVVVEDVEPVVPAATTTCCPLTWMGAIVLSVTLDLSFVER